MGGPSFASRRQNAGNLPAFELPPPPMNNSHKYQYAVHGNQGSQTPGSMSSVGNLLTPPSTVGGQDVSPSPTGTVPSLNTQVSQAPQQQQHQQHQQQQQQQQQHQHYSNGYTSWSPSPSHQQQYYTHHQSNAQTFQHNRMPYSPAPTVVRGSHPHSPQTSEGAPMQAPYDLPPFPASAPLTPATVQSMSSTQAPSHHQMHPGMMSSNTPVSSAGNHPSPVHSQEGFRAPPTPTYYSHPHSQPHSPYPFSTGPQQQMTLSSTGPMVSRAQMSPASTGPMPALPAPSMHSPAGMQGRFASYGPVMSNMHNPNGQPMLVGALPHGMVASFNSGHAASLQTMYGSPAPQSQPQNDRPFKCDQCPQSFNRNHDLKRHKRIHLAVKPFPCGHCDKSFSRKDALKVCFPVPSAS
jgi:uncharacterized Zn-finger protein